MYTFFVDLGKHDVLTHVGEIWRYRNGRCYYYYKFMDNCGPNWFGLVAVRLSAGYTQTHQGSNRFVLAHLASFKKLWLMARA